MKKKLILYHYFPKEMPHKDMAQCYSELFSFAEMLGKNIVGGVYGDMGKPQTNLDQALDLCREQSAYLLTNDLNSLCPTKNEAMALINQLQDEMLFVMFVDDKSVMETIAPDLYE